MKTLRTTALLGTMLALVACTDDLDPASLVNKTRIVGAKVRSETEPSSTWVRPGERASFELFTVFAREPRPLAWIFGACVPAPVLTGGAFCGSEPFDVQMGSGDTVRHSFDMPSADVLGTADNVLLIGAVCAGGTPSFDLAKREARCDGEAPEQMLLTMLVPIRKGDATNADPNVRDRTWKFGEQVWASPTAPPALDGCAALAASPELPHVRAGAEEPVVFSWMLAESDRETFMTMPTDGSMPEMRREELQLTHLATAGELERSFSVVEDDGPMNSLAIEVEWTAPPLEEVPEGGLLVRHHVVVRDLRAGMDWATRYVCVTR